MSVLSGSFVDSFGLSFPAFSVLCCPVAGVCLYFCLVRFCNVWVLLWNHLGVLPIYACFACRSGCFIWRRLGFACRFPFACLGFYCVRLSCLCVGSPCCGLTLAFVCAGFPLVCQVVSRYQAGFCMVSWNILNACFLSCLFVLALLFGFVCLGNVWYFYRLFVLVCLLPFSAVVSWCGSGCLLFLCCHPDVCHAFLLSAFLALSFCPLTVCQSVESFAVSLSVGWSCCLFGAFCQLSVCVACWSSIICLPLVCFVISVFYLHKAVVFVGCRFVFCLCFFCIFFFAFSCRVGCLHLACQTLFVVLVSVTLLDVICGFPFARLVSGYARFWLCFCFWSLVSRVRPPKKWWGFFWTAWKPMAKSDVVFVKIGIYFLQHILFFPCFPGFYPHRGKIKMKIKWCGFFGVRCRKSFCPFSWSGSAVNQTGVFFISLVPALSVCFRVCKVLLFCACFVLFVFCFPYLFSVCACLFSVGSICLWGICIFAVVSTEHGMRSFLFACFGFCCFYFLCGVVCLFYFVCRLWCTIFCFIFLCCPFLL